MEDTNGLADYLAEVWKLNRGSRAEQEMAVVNMRRMRAAMTTPDLLYAEKSRILVEKQYRDQDRKENKLHRRVLTWARSL